MAVGQLSYTTSQIDMKLTGAYGGIHQHDNSTAQSIPTGATYTKIINWVDNDTSANCTPDATNGKITITNAGTYRVEGSFSMSSGTNNTTVYIAPFLDDVEQNSIHIVRKIATAGDIGNASFTGLLDITAGQILDVRTRHDIGSAVDLTFQYMNMNITRVDI